MRTTANENENCETEFVDNVSDILLESHESVWPELNAMTALTVRQDNS
jgi:hypothetical protein